MKKKDREKQCAQAQSEILRSESLHTESLHRGFLFQNRFLMFSVLAVLAILLENPVMSRAGGLECLNSLVAGVSTILDADIADPSYGDSAQAPAGIEGQHSASADVRSISENYIAESQAQVPEETQAEPESNRVMANVKNALNVRTEANEESELAGYLYADCGGEILERSNGWTKLKSGNLTGWAKDDYLLFGSEADQMAQEMGNLVVTIRAEALRVRKEPSEDAGVYGLLAKDDELDVLEDLEGWVSIQYGSDTGYISKEYVDADFHIDAGETVEAVKAREKKEAEAKAKRTANRGAVNVDAADDQLLAALIQCEAGNQPYEGMVGVGAVVMNRVKSGGYPNTVRGVIYASGQFTPALSGKVDRLLAKGNVKASCLQAAQEAIAGNTTVGGAMHFRRAGSREGIIIGNHVFW